MAYTARMLINDAYYLSGIVGKSFESVSGPEVENGLQRLNAFLAVKGANRKLIPYYTVFDGEFVAQEEKFFVPNLVEIDTFTFFLTNTPDSEPKPVRLGLDNSTRYQYFQSARPEGIDAIPCYYRFENVKGGADLRVYPLPQIAYKWQMTGKFSLSDVALNQDLSLIYDGWYLEYLRYGLAVYLCEWMGVVPAQSLLKTMNELEYHNMTLSPIDFTFRQKQYFNKRGGLNWGDCNYGKTWRGG